MSQPAALSDRAWALVRHLSVAEKIACCHQHVPALESLGLAPFRTGTEAAHGVAWLGTATVFPQPVGLAASWDLDLLHRVGTAVGTEVRAKHAADPTVSLNVWAPVVNPLRHPRWGRTEEGFSEDPWLTAELATAYAGGLRGDHPQIWRTVPTLKHVIGYSHETDRDVTSAALWPRTLHEYELPAFLGPLRAGVIGAVMPSYNLVNHRPAHLSREILELLRSASPHPLLVVSDAGAPTNLAGSQGYCPDHVTSHAAALRAGIDSFTDGDRDAGPTTARLTAALAAGLIDESDLDRAVHRLLHLRLLTGESPGTDRPSPADPHADPYADPYAGIGPDDLDTPAHRHLAREAVARSVVLLTNDHGLLPLRSRADGGSTGLAVVGPFARRVLTDWYAGTPPYTVGLGEALAQAWSEPDAVELADGADVVLLRSTTSGRYLRLAADGRVRADGRADDPSCRFTLDDWGHGVTTVTAASGRLLTVADGRTVTATAERVGGWVVQESFRAHGDADGTTRLEHLGSRSWLRLPSAGTALETGAPDAAAAESFVVSVVVSGLAEVAAVCSGAEVVVVTVGNDPHLGGRETQDRPDLWLPGRQRELLRVARAANPRCVLLIVSSYPYVLDTEERSCPAVVWSSHGGQELGHGVADVLLGDREPTGRLAQTWPADPADVGGLLDYDLGAAGLTYGYSTAEPLYPFGHGRGFHEPSWGAVRPTELTRTADDPRPIRIELDLRSTADTSGVAVVQAYGRRTTPDRLSYPVRLLGWARVELVPGEVRTVVLDLDPTRLQIWDARAGGFRLPPGDYEITVGRSLTDVHGTVAVAVTGVEPAPAPLGRCRLRAADADAHVDAELVPDTLLDGEAVTARAGCAVADLQFWSVDLRGRTSLTLRLRGHGTVSLAHRAHSSAHDTWVPIGRVYLEPTEQPPEQPSAQPTPEWVDVAVAVSPALGVGDLRVRVAAGLEIASIGP